MAHLHLDLARSAHQTELTGHLAALRRELSLPDGFPPEVLADAERAAAAMADRLPQNDRTDLPLLTIDPPGSTDLDQAVHIRRGTEVTADANGRGGAAEGFTVHYAIADVPAFITPGGALDAETLRRGQTIYLPDRRIPLHPEVISEDTGSLLPGADRGAYLWTFHLDAGGAVVSTGLERARVRSREQLTYDQAQQRIDGGGSSQHGAEASSTLALLREVGLLRTAQEIRRGGASLRLPAQEVTATDHGYEVLATPPLDVEDWNAQISLMTGIAAADIMLTGQIGILRTMPPADAESEATFRARTRALGHPWAQDQPYGEYLRGLDTTDPRELAIMHAATSLFRGAGYTAFDGDTPEVTVQAAIAAPYAHTTAPLRRLVDRFVLVTCLALAQGQEVPQPVRDLLPALPAAMQESGRLASQASNAALQLVEAASLSGLEGREFSAVVISAPSPAQAEKARAEGRLPWGEVQVAQPPVLARYEGFAEAGSEVRVELVTADLPTRTVLFRIAGQAPETLQAPEALPAPEALHAPDRTSPPGRARDRAADPVE